MEPLVAISFDCWNTLLYERDPGATYARRVERLASTAGQLGVEVDLLRARRALDRAWERHWALWHEEVASGASEMASWALSILLGEPAPGEESEDLGRAISEEALASDVPALAGAPEALEALAGRGLRCALVCDTGLSSGGVVRRLLDRQGLLEHLEVTVFSDEVGVPKPNSQVFEAALAPLGLSDRPSLALHVGDLLRTDVSGARSAGMGTVRIRERHDDRGDLPEADHVIDRHGELLALLDERMGPARPTRSGAGS